MKSIAMPAASIAFSRSMHAHSKSASPFYRNSPTTGPAQSEPRRAETTLAKRLSSTTVITGSEERSLTTSRTASSPPLQPLVRRSVGDYQVPFDHGHLAGDLIGKLNVAKVLYRNIPVSVMVLFGD